MFAVESIFPDESETRGPAEAMPFICSLFFTLKSLSDNVVHISPNCYKIIIALIYSFIGLTLLPKSVVLISFVFLSDTCPPFSSRL